MFSETDFEAHTCDTPLKGCKIIQVTEFYDGSYKDKKLMNGMGTDGVLYTFEVVPRKAIPITIPLNNNPSDDSYHANKNDDKLTEPGFKDLPFALKVFWWHRFYIYAIRIPLEAGR